MHNYSYSIKVLKEKQTELVKGFEYVNQSALQGVEQEGALGKIRHRLKRNGQAIEILEFLQKKAIFTE